MIRGLSLFLTILVLGACTEKISDKRSSPRNDADAGAVDSNKALAIVQTSRDLPACVNSREGVTFYIVVENEFRFCSKSKKWATIGIKGKDGINPLVFQSEESAGTNCAHGGSKWVVGYDSNNDGNLSASESSQTTYICNGNPTPPVPNAQLTSITITPVNESAPVGFSPKFTAVATWDNGMKLDVTESSLLVWESSDVDVIEVYNFSGIRGKSYLNAEGTATIKATYDGGVFGSTQFTVDPAVVTSVEVDDYLNLVLGWEGQEVGFVTASAQYSNYDNVDITNDATTIYESSNTAVATVSNVQESRAKVTAQGVGCAEITASAPTPWQAPESKLGWIYGGLNSSVDHSNYYDGVSVRQMSISHDITLHYRQDTYNLGSNIEINPNQEKNFTVEIDATYENGTPVSLASLTPNYTYNSPVFVKSLTQTATGASGEFNPSATGQSQLQVSLQFPVSSPGCGNSEPQPNPKQQPIFFFHVNNR